jgi:potassium-transporting ATPase KdpC subunit
LPTLRNSRRWPTKPRKAAPSSSSPKNYDAANSQGSNFGPTNHKLIDRVQGDLARLNTENPGAPVPADLVTASASGLDPDISPAGAEFQIPRVARERGWSQEKVRRMVQAHIRPRQSAVLGEPRVNVLELNLALDGK